MQSNAFNHNTFLEFKRCLEERSDFAVATKNKYLATARIFLKELNRRGLIPTDITQNIKAFTQSNRHKLEGLNQAEIETFGGESAQSTFHAQVCPPKGIILPPSVPRTASNRDYPTRCRRPLFGEQKASIQGKGRDDKESIYLLPETVKSLRSHLKVNKVSTGAVFKSLGNRKSERITTMTIKRELKELFEQLGIDKTVHGFRHYFITTLLKRFDVRDVRKFSRHKNLEMLIVYDDEVDIGEKAVMVAECFDTLKICK